MATRKPIIQHKQVSASTVVVKVFAEGLKPNNSKKLQKVDVVFHKQGLDVTIAVQVENQMKNWKYQAVRLPSQIEPGKCTWEIKKGEVFITLVKRRQDCAELEESDQYQDWSALLGQNGLDQYDSSEDEDERTPAFYLNQLPSEKLPPGIRVEHGKNNVYEIDDLNDAPWVQKILE